MRRLAFLMLAGALAVAGATTAGAKPPPKKGTNQLSAATNPFVITFGRATTLSGKITGPNSGGVRVALLQDPFPYGDGYTPLATATTAANGTYSFRLLPALNTNYRVTAGQLTATTGVRVRTRVTLSVSDSTPAKGQRVRFFGSVYPRHDGRVLRIQRRRASGSWATVRTTTLRHTVNGNRSTYSTRITIRSSGTYRARLVSDGDHLTGTSRTRSLTVH